MLPDLESRFRGALLGLACGDAVGTTVEFSPRGSFAPVTDMVGGGPFNLQPGQWTDDTSMALCLAESLLTKGFDAHDQMTRYLNWWQWGYLSSTGQCFDIGMTVGSALREFQVSGNPFSGSPDSRAAGNGALMRLAPVVLFAHPDIEKVLHFSGESSRTTHGAAEAIESSRAFALLLHALLNGVAKYALLESVASFTSTEPKVREILAGAFLDKDEKHIRGSGYCIESLEAALWCFLHTDSFESAVLRAVNLGDDADTTGAIVGQLAGAHYGVEGIPGGWLEKLAMREDIDGMARGLFARAVA